MFGRLDSSTRISRFLEWVSTAMARQRGLPMLIGFVLVILSGFCFGMTMLALVLTDRIASIWLWFCPPLFLLHLGIIVGFLGFMLATPLGEEHRSFE